MEYQLNNTIEEWKSPPEYVDCICCGNKYLSEDICFVLVNNNKWDIWEPVCYDCGWPDK